MAGEKWFLASDGKGYGPFSSAQLQQMTEAGVVDADDLVWCADASESIPVSAVGNEPPLPVAASRPSPPPLPVPNTPASSHRPSRLGLWLSLAAVLLAMLGGGGWLAYDRGWLPFARRLDLSNASVAENSSANNASDEEADEPDSPALAAASDVSPDLAEVAPQSFHGLNDPPEETAPEATEPVTLPVPVLYLPFDQSVATIPPNLAFTRKGGRYAAGKIGQAVSFDGNSYAELKTTLPLGNAPRTMAFWVRNERGPVELIPFVVTQTEKWERAKAFGIIERKGNWRFQDMNGDLDSGIKVDREWHHLAVTHDGTTISFFLDGEKVVEADRNLETETRRLRIGGIGSPDNNFVGLIDELYVFDVPLMGNQIRQLMNRTGSSSAPRPSSSGRDAAGNVALASRGATATGPYAKTELLLDGKANVKDNYAKARLNVPIVVTLPEVYRLRSVRIRLVETWSSDNSTGYRYKMEVSEDGVNYKTVADRTSGLHRDWQNIEFSPRPVKAIRITGTHDHPHNTGIRIAEVEAFCTEWKPSTSQDVTTRSQTQNSGQQGNLQSRLKGTKWVNSSNVSFEWTKDGRFLHRGTELQWKVTGKNRVEIIFGPNHRDTLEFDETFQTFKQLVRGGKNVFTGRRKN